MLESRGLSALECLVTAEGGKVFLPVENFQEFTAHLDAGEEMGMLRPLGSPPSCCEDTTPTLPSTTATVKTTPPSPEQLERLLKELKLPVDKLSPEEEEELKAVMCLHWMIPN